MACRTLSGYNFPFLLLKKRLRIGCCSKEKSNFDQTESIIATKWIKGVLESLVCPLTGTH